MPKMKTKSGAKKRFRVTGKGKVKSGSAFTSHMMMNKSNKQKRKARGKKMASAADAVTILRNFLPYARKKKAKATTSRPLEG